MKVVISETKYPIEISELVTVEVEISDFYSPYYTTVENDFVVGGGGTSLGTWVKKTLAETKTILGIVIATAAEIIAGIDDSKIVTAKGLKDADILPGSGVMPNLLINGEMRIAQTGTSFTSTTVPANSDDTYLLDQVILLSDGNDIVDVTQSTDAPVGFSYSLKAEVETPNKQFAFLFPVEAKDAKQVIGGTASLSFYAKMAAADDNTHSLKANILSWSSTADTITSDVIGTWAATITPAANWTAENTASSNTLTTSWQRFEIDNIAIDTASTANIAALIYCDQTDGAVDDAVFITGVKAENSAVCTDYFTRPYIDELMLCRRYCYTIKCYGANTQQFALQGFVATTTICDFIYTLPAEMLGMPTVSVSALANIKCTDGISVDSAIDSSLGLLTTQSGNFVVKVRATYTGAIWTVGRIVALYVNGATDWIKFESRL